MRADVPSGDVLAGGSIRRVPMVRSWLAGELLANDVPVLGGSVTWTTAQEVPGTLSLTVPRSSLGVDWLPRSPDHPLARFGQVLEVLVQFRAPVSERSWDVRWGTFRIEDWQDQGETIAVTARSMFAVVEGDKFVSPMPSRRGGTMITEAKRLLPPSLGMLVDPALTDRPVPAMAWGESRLEALYEIADAWPARLREDVWGQAVWLPPLPESPEPVLTLTDGENGTVVSVARSDTRAGAYNRIVARGQETTDAGAPAVQGVADVVSGPMATSGPYGVEVRYFVSPLIQTVTQARRSALTMAQSAAVASRTVRVTLPPDPRIELDDPVAVRFDGDLLWGWVTGVEFPLTVNDGPMVLDVGVAA